MGTRLEIPRLRTRLEVPMLGTTTRAPLLCFDKVLWQPSFGIPVRHAISSINTGSFITGSLSQDIETMLPRSWQVADIRCN
jgi:hypothetical protein